MLSKHIGSRSPVQCRSHHQKMIKAFKTPEAIIAHFLTPSAPDLEKSSVSGESSQARPLEGLASPLQTSCGTSTEDFAFGEEEKMMNFGGNSLACCGELSLWDVLTDNQQEGSIIDFL